MDAILCHFIYVGKDSSIQKIVKRKEVLSTLNENENGEMGIHSDRILQIIQTRKTLNNGLKYKIISFCKFFVDFGHDSLFQYVYGKNGENSSKNEFFREVSILEKVVIEPSLPIFHALNSLYFIFKEDAMVKKSMKSILKIEGASEFGNISRSRSTKKVRIFEEGDQGEKSNINTDPKNKVRKTRKNK
jgi:hypothetical protein